MQIKFVKSLWGYEPAAATLEQKLARIRTAGYDGVECPCPEVSAAEWQELCARYGLTYVGMFFVDDIAGYRRELERLVPYRPVCATLHALRDRTPFDEGCRFLREAVRIEADLGVAVAHETHRGRMLCNPWQTSAYLEAVPEVQICADFSHFCNVCESLLDNMQDFLEVMIPRAIHIHGRIGWEEAAQVNDPRAPEHAHRVARHEEWWDAIRAAGAAVGRTQLTFDPEFGPPDYLPTLPWTRQPVTDLWEISLWMAQRMRARWSSAT
ncbi:MAG: sugar phosphate isomerase/epimerase [Phycisphaerales bacterium]|nr:sugar phosphate isomerase/epimerase [Phycisphaerales bacterium]